MPTNDLGQSIGRDLAGWTRPDPVHAVPLAGNHVHLRPLHVDDAEPVFAALRDTPPEAYTYMAFEPFQSADDVANLIEFMEAQPDWIPYAIEVDSTPQGFGCYLRIDPPNGAVEIGSILYSPALQRTTAATEAMYLMIRHAFAGGYRRVEWKCDALNEPSRSAGERLGFQYEGTFRNATHYKGRNRDTAWFAMTLEDWPIEQVAFERWLDPANFDDSGIQITSLTSVRERVALQ